MPAYECKDLISGNSAAPVFDMLVEQSNAITPMTPVLASPGSHPTDLSPRSSHSSSSLISNESSTHSSSTATPIKDLQTSSDEYSALQNLEYALEEGNSVLSSRFPTKKTQPNQQLKQHQNSSGNSKGSPNGSIETINHLVQTPTSSQNEVSTPAKIFECPLCSIEFNSRHQFNEHLVTHSQQHACPKCTFLASTADKLRCHLQEAHNIKDTEDVTDDEVRVPKINSQGKMKTFKCKQCEYVTVTKMEFWAHSKSHIRQEKMLACPKCPFVTEYKHHLEYHLRNHYGSKPFQCSKCAYTCVNKSMLNSHLKSHSNVYQYRCSDCSYATKYCHSLKLHLRKYSHNPSMVLNPDGTPNPLPIIDVYGTRRGPKMKRTDTTNANFRSALPPNAECNSNASSNDLLEGNDNKSGYSFGSAPVSPQFPGAGIKREFHVNNVGVNRGFRGKNSLTPPLKRSASDTSDSDNEIRNQKYQRRLQLQMPEIPVPQNPMFQHSPGDFNSVYDMAAKIPFEIFAVALNLYSNPMLNNSQPLQDFAKIAKDQSQQTKLLPQILQSPVVPVSATSPLEFLHLSLEETSQAPLDLRNPKVVPESKSEEIAVEDLKRRKRKGTAVRFGRQNAKFYSNKVDDVDKVLDFSNNNSTSVLSKFEAETVNKVPMQCKYCEISFADSILYSMHMSYHSDDFNPFLCKSCGKRTPDKVAFCRHLTTDSH